MFCYYPQTTHSFLCACASLPTPTDGAARIFSLTPPPWPGIKLALVQLHILEGPWFRALYQLSYLLYKTSFCPYRRVVHWVLSLSVVVQFWKAARLRTNSPASEGTFHSDSSSRFSLTRGRPVLTKLSLRPTTSRLLGSCAWLPTQRRSWRRGWTSLITAHKSRRA